MPGRVGFLGEAGAPLRVQICNRSNFSSPSCWNLLFAVFESFKDYVATEQLDGDNKYDAGEHGLQVRIQTFCSGGRFKKPFYFTFHVGKSGTCLDVNAGLTSASTSPEVRHIDTRGAEWWGPLSSPRLRDARARRAEKGPAGLESASLHSSCSPLCNWRRNVSSLFICGTQQMCAFHRRHALRAWTRLTTACLLKAQVAVRRDRVKDFYLLGQKKKQWTDCDRERRCPLLEEQKTILMKIIWLWYVIKYKMLL